MHDGERLLSDSKRVHASLREGELPDEPDAFL